MLRAAIYGHESVSAVCGAAELSVGDAEYERWANAGGVYVWGGAVCDGVGAGAGAGAGGSW